MTFMWTSIEVPPFPSPLSPALKHELVVLWSSLWLTAVTPWGRCLNTVTEKILHRAKEADRIDPTVSLRSRESNSLNCLVLVSPLMWKIVERSVVSTWIVWGWPMNFRFIPEFGAMNSILTSFCEVFITQTEEVLLRSLRSPQNTFNLPYVLIGPSYACMYGWTWKGSRKFPEGLMEQTSHLI